MPKAIIIRRGELKDGMKKGSEGIGNRWRGIFVKHKGNESCKKQNGPPLKVLFLAAGGRRTARTSIYKVIV